MGGSRQPRKSVRLISSRDRRESRRRAPALPPDPFAPSPPKKSGISPETGIMLALGCGVAAGAGLLLMAFLVVALAFFYSGDGSRGAGPDPVVIDRVDRAGPLDRSPSDPEVFEFIGTIEYVGPEGRATWGTGGALGVKAENLSPRERVHTFGWSFLVGEPGASEAFQLEGVGAQVLRDRETERIIGGEEVFRHFAVIANAALAQSPGLSGSTVSRERRVINLPVTGPDLPNRLAFFLESRPLFSRRHGDLVLLLALSEPFSYRDPETGARVEAQHRALALLDQSMNHLFHGMSVFEARSAGGVLRIERSLLRTEGGQRLNFPGLERELLPFFERMDLAEGAVATVSNVTPPIWALHSLAAHGLADLAASAAIEGKSNFALLATIGAVLLVDAAVSLTTGALKRRGVIEREWKGIPNYLGQGLGLGFAGAVNLAGGDMDYRAARRVGGITGDFASLFIPTHAKAHGIVVGSKYVHRVRNTHAAGIISGRRNFLMWDGYTRRAEPVARALKGYKTSVDIYSAAEDGDLGHVALSLLEFQTRLKPLFPGLSPSELRRLYEEHLRPRPDGVAEFDFDEAIASAREISKLPTKAIDLILSRSGAGSRVVRQVEVLIPDTGVERMDVVFCVDVSGSYGPFVRNFERTATDIMREIGERVPDVRFALTSFSDFPIRPFGNPRSGDRAFYLNQRLTDDPAAVARAISALSIHSGGDTPESQLEAVYQILTGAGRRVEGNRQANIEPGSVGWRTGTLRIIVLATDAGFHDSDRNPSYPGAGFSEVIRLLRESGTIVIGLDTGSARADLSKLSEASGGQIFPLSASGEGTGAAILSGLDLTLGSLTIVPQVLDDASSFVQLISPGEATAAPGETVVFDLHLGQDPFAPPTTASSAASVVWMTADGSAVIKRVPIQATFDDP